MKKTLGILALLAILTTTAPAQQVDPAFMQGRSLRIGTALEVDRPVNAPKFSFNFLTLKEATDRSFDGFFRPYDATIYTGAALGYDLFQGRNYSVKALAGYTANFNDLRNVRSGEWSVGLAVRVRF